MGWLLKAIRGSNLIPLKLLLLSLFFILSPNFSVFVFSYFSFPTHLDVIFYLVRLHYLIIVAIIVM